MAKKQAEYKPDKQLLLDSIQSLTESLEAHKNKPESFVRSIKDMIAEKQSQLEKHYGK